MLKTALQPDVFNRACPSRDLLHTVANKWTMLVVDGLGQDSLRNSELLRRIGGISQKMLSQTLRELVDLGLVRRHDFQRVPPHVEYTLTTAGKSMQAEVCQLNRWVERYMGTRLNRSPKADWIQSERE